MASVEVQMSDSEYRLVIDGDDDVEFTAYGEPAIVEFDDGETYWCLANAADEECEVYKGVKVSATYEDVELDSNEETVEVEQES